MRGSIMLAPSGGLGRRAGCEFGAALYGNSQSQHPIRRSLWQGCECNVARSWATYRTAPDTLVELGAEIVTLGVAPDGLNINLNCGATAPAAMAKAVIESGALIGICLDGDADRLILADEQGQIRDGDQILAALALDAAEQGTLDGPVISTVMDNLGLETLLARHNIGFERSAVGDRYIYERMIKTGSTLGGEPQVIFCYNRLAQEQVNCCFAGLVGNVSN